MALEQFQNNEMPAEIPAEAPVKKEEPSKETAYANDAAVRLQQKRREYDLHLQKLIDKASQRQTGYNPKLMALGAGLLTPGKTGSFFEGLGLGTKGYMEAGEKEIQTDMERAKLENELRTGQIGQLEKDYALEQELAGDKYMRDLATKRLTAPSTDLAVSGKTDARSIISGGGSMGYGSGPNGLITQQDIMMAPKGAQKRIIEDYKRQQDDIKILQEGSKSTEVNVPFLGAQKISVKQQQEIDTIVANPQYQALSVPEKKKLMSQYYADNGIGEVQYADTGTSGVSKSTEPSLETTTEKGLRVEKQKERAKSEIKQNEEDIKFIETKRDNANTLITNAKGVYNFATNPETKDTFGILSKGGFLSGLGEVIKEPLKIGDVSVGVSNVENIVRKTFKSDKEIDAAMVAGQYIANLELSFSQALKGQGQVSDNERLIVAKVGPSISDSPKVAALKAESIMARGTFDQRNAELFQNAQNANPELTYRQYKNSTQYKGLVDQYNNKLGDLLEKYEMAPKKAKTETTTQPTKSSLWSQIKEQNKE
jgi:hypothetical protein